MKLFAAALLALVACAAACEHDKLYPNPEDCTTFLQCGHGHLYVLQCPSGQTYNPPLERCDWPSEDDACHTEAKAHGPVPAPVHAPAKARAELVCPPVGSSDEAVQIPNPDDCGSFYKCDVDGVPWLNECPPGLHYNPELKVCDYPQVAGCLVR